MLKNLAESVGIRLKKAGKKAGMLSVEIRYFDFRNASHQMQLEKPSAQPEVLLEKAGKLFQELWSGEPVRLLGIRTSKLVEESAPEQLTLFDLKPPEEPDEKHKKLKAALEELNSRFGKDTVIKRNSVPSEEKVRAEKCIARHRQCGQQRQEKKWHIKKIMLCYSSESLCKEGSVVRLDTLLERLEYKVVQGSAETEVTTLINDSRKVENGSVFVCISGAVSDGHKYAAEVAEKRSGCSRCGERCGSAGRCDGH